MSDHNSDDITPKISQCAPLLRMLYTLYLNDMKSYKKSNIIDVEWCAVMLLGIKPLIFKPLQLWMGRDKARVSRSLKSMEQVGLVLRELPRDPFELTPLGKITHQKISAIAAQRTKELTLGLSAEDIEWFNQIIEHLIHNSRVVLVESDPNIALDITQYEYPSIEEMGDAKLLYCLQHLLLLISQASTLRYRYMSNLTRFDADIIITVKYQSGISISGLTKMLDKDKGQVGRTVKKLTDLDLLYRKSANGLVRKGVYLSVAGEEKYLEIQALFAGLDSMQLKGLSEEMITRFFILVDKLYLNIQTMEDAYYRKDSSEKPQNLWSVV